MDRKEKKPLKQAWCNYLYANVYLKLEAPMETKSIMQALKRQRDLYEPFYSVLSYCIHFACISCLCACAYGSWVVKNKVSILMLYGINGVLSQKPGREKILPSIQPPRRYLSYSYAFKELRGNFLPLSNKGKYEGVGGNRYTSLPLCWARMSQYDYLVSLKLHLKTK